MAGFEPATSRPPVARATPALHSVGLGGGTWTHGLRVPNAARYQTALHLDGRVGESRTPDLLVPNQARYHCATTRYSLKLMFTVTVNIAPQAGFEPAKADLEDRPGVHTLGLKQLPARASVDGSTAWDLMEPARSLPRHCGRNTNISATASCRSTRSTLCRSTRRATLPNRAWS